MAIQQIETINLQLQGDGVATTFLFGFNKLFAFYLNGDTPLSFGTIPSSALVASQNGTLPAGATASIDGFGNLTITFPSAPANGAIGVVSIQVFFNSNAILSGTTSAWTSATAVNTTWTLPLNGSTATSIGFIVSGSITGGVIAFQVSQDGSNWLPIQGAIANGFTALTGWTFGVGSQAVQFDVSGYAYIRLLLSTALVGTGTLTFILQGTSVGIEPTVVVGQTIASSNQTQDNAIYNSSAPAPASGATVGLQADAFGNVFVNNIRRSQVIPVTGNIAATAAATVLAAQGAGVFADLSSLILTLREGATANVFFGVNVSDGTKTYRFNFMSQDVTTFQPAAPLVMNFDPPLPATNANTAWTIALTSATDSPSVDYVGTFTLQKAE